MSDEERNDEQEGAPDASAPKRGRLPLVIALMVGIAIGGMAGSLIVGPLMAEGEEAACECGGAAEGEHGASGAKPSYTVNDLVLNPARSGGTRYLVLTIAFSVRDSAVVQKMGERDPEVRDILLKVLGAKTVAELTDVSARPALKEEVRAQVGRLFGEKTIHDVFFPQYVVQ